MPAADGPRDTSPRLPEGVVLLVGAGSSCHLGLPTLDDLLQRAVIGEDDVAARIRQTRQAIEAQPSRFRPAVFEELIARIKQYLATAQMLRTDATLRREIGSLPHDVDNGWVERKFKQSLSRCYRILLEEYGPRKIDPRSREFSTTVELLRTLSDINGGELHVYTTNYDCSFQVLASHPTQLTFLTHIDSQRGKFTERWHSNLLHPEPDLHRVYVHRLHGCIAWFNVTGDQPGVGTVVKEIYGSGKELVIDNDDFLDQMCIKLIASQLIGANPAFAAAFDELANSLRTAKVLLVWGYSFHDLEVVRAINHAVAERSTPLPILYLDPYLREFVLRETIERTLMQAPLQTAKSFMPQRIDWTPSDGLPELVPCIKRAINQVLGAPTHA